MQLLRSSLGSVPGIKILITYAQVTGQLS
eukprot:COSAG02_NODE_51881_length_311_cov_0.886792_1_plen_28_part_01